MTISSLNDALLLAAAGAFGGYTYWAVTNALTVLREKVRARRQL